MQKRPALHFISNARIQKETDTELIVSPPLAWLSPIFGAVVFTLIGVMLIVADKLGLTVLGVVGLGLAVMFLAIAPLATHLTFDFSSQQLTFVVEYVIHWPRRLEVRAPLRQLVQVSLRPALLGRRNIVDVVLADGTRIVLQFGRRYAEVERFVNRLGSLAGTEAAPVLNAPQAVTALEVTGTQSLMYRELRSWGVWLLVMGGAQMVAAQGFSPWGTLLIGIGLASFYLRESPMFLIYAVTVAWAGLSNLLHGEGLWKGFALFQGLLTYQLFVQFQRFRRVEHLPPTEISTDLPATPEPNASRPPERARNLFPWLALILGASSLTVFILSFAGSVVNVLFFKNKVFTTAFGALEIIAIYSGILGFASGLAGWIAGYPRKGESIVGCILGAVTLIIELGLGLWGQF